jgi:hypothetical protein
MRELRGSRAGSQGQEEILWSGSGGDGAPRTKRRPLGSRRAAPAAPQPLGHTLLTVTGGAVAASLPLGYFSPSGGCCSHRDGTLVLAAAPPCRSSPSHCYVHAMHGREPAIPSPVCLRLTSILITIENGIFFF